MLSRQLTGIHLIGLALISFMMTACEAQKQQPFLSLQTESGYIIPPGAHGIAIISRPREATLLQLRGMTGRGNVILKDSQHGKCLKIPVRFAAGDFGGGGIGIHQAKPVLLEIRSAQAAEVLAGDKDIVSDQYRIGTDTSADIVILSGLAMSQGFVLNPGLSFMAEIMGTQHQRVDCTGGT
ncbi:hypothetical protein [Gynuella sunshinyii]|uniref:Uncharacterized protein n=1 Tax=Gynuella sunshinyii YC6258 TaxID=1445510 RepID=A0A0C5VRZ7_9GAMM|nr:hypothetical protein [Gynuella sunshinyii]AJQ93044.1 hypothetical Protein YC6258_00994 [Gynuella sunshinyii YC6258]